MASLRKKGKTWYYRFTDADGVQRERPGCTDKRETEAMQAKARAEAAKIRDGYVTAKAAAGMLPSLKPEENKPEALAATGTEGRPINEPFSLLLPYSGDVSGRNCADQDVMADSNVLTSIMRSSLENEALDAPMRGGTESVGESAARIRTGE